MAILASGGAAAASTDACGRSIMAMFIVRKSLSDNTSARALLAEDSPRQDVDDEHGQRNQQRSGPREIFPVFERTHCKLQDDDRQVRHRPVHVRAPELI